MTFLDLFAGIGGFRRGLERSGHTCVGHVEIDKYANKSYMAMYGLEVCPYGEWTHLDSNCCRICSREVRENCDGKECKGEWYAKDIKQLTAGEVPRTEIWTFGFPCTDISISGRMAGLHGERSGLFFAVTGLLKSTAAEDKPRYLIIENVKHLVSCEKGGDFTTVLLELWEAGYDCEWSVVNSKDFGVPQHRERVYIVGHLGGRCGREIFPVGGANPAPVKRLIDGKQGKRVYDPEGTSITLNASGGGFAGRTGLYAVSINRQEGITGELDQAHTLTASDARGLNRNQDQNAVLVEVPPCASFIDLSRKPKFTEYAHCIMAKQYAGISNHKGESSGIFICKGNPECVRAVTTPDRKSKAQNGRRVKAPGEPCFTLTCQEPHGILLCCLEERPDIQEIPQEGCTIGGNHVYICCRIRRLTPRECWRLQAFEDYLFDRAKAAGISDAQLYKQAGNAVTVNVVYEIGLRLSERGLTDEV